MEVSYKRHFTQSYMVIKSEGNCEETYELEILTYNQIPHLLKAQMEVSDGELQFWYDITGKQTLTDHMERRQVDSSILLLLFQTLAELYEETEEYLLEENHIILEQEYIYVNHDSNSMEFVYLPGQDRDIRESFQELMEQLLRKLNHSDKQAADMAYEMYQQSLKREKHFLDMLQQVTATVNEGDDMEPVADTNERVDRDATTTISEKSDRSATTAISERADRGATTILSGKNDCLKRKPLPGIFKKSKKWLEERFSRAEREEEPLYVTGEEEPVVYPTEILTLTKETYGILKYQGVGESHNIRIDKPVFLIGKKENEVDGFIDAKSVSRIHARIEMVEENYYIEDLNSTNGTYLNGEQLEYRQKARLELRDRITFGTEEYIFM